jgi:hypothetical protein
MSFQFLRKDRKLAALWILFLMLGLTACSDSDFSGETQTEIADSQPQKIGTDGALISIQSDNINAAGYNASTLVMTVQFKNGAIYEYYGVEAELWLSFIAAQPHPWSQVGYPRLVQDAIPYKRIG